MILNNDQEHYISPSLFTSKTRQQTSDGIFDVRLREASHTVCAVLNPSHYTELQHRFPQRLITTPALQLLITCTRLEPGNPPTNSRLFLLGVQILFQGHTKLFPQRLKLLQILFVLSLVLNLGLDTCCDPCQQSTLCLNFLQRGTRSVFFFFYVLHAKG